jgi:3-deoxy-7-phosphoheptulonate synthase
VILFFKTTAAEQQATQAQERLAMMGLNTRIVTGAQGILLIIQDDVSVMPTHVFSQLPGVAKVIRTQSQCSLVLKDSEGAVKLSTGLTIGGKQKPVVIAGPCSVEGQVHAQQVARCVKESGADMLRGGAFKPRSSPYDFQGLGKEALKYLAEARTSTGLPVVSEVMSAEQVEQAYEYLDMFQIGARNMYNYELLKEVGKTDKPVLLKRAMSATIQELLNAAEYILLEGNSQVVLCERGIRTFETHTRNTLDLSAVAALKLMTSLPVLVDPSHATGRPELIRPMSRAAIACGADGLLIEVHESPNEALSDGEQAINSATLKDIVRDVAVLYAAITGKESGEAAAAPHAVTSLQAVSSTR